MELGTYSDLTSFIGEAFPYYRTWQSFTFLFWVGQMYIKLQKCAWAWVISVGGVRILAYYVFAKLKKN